MMLMTTAYSDNSIDLSTQFQIQKAPILFQDIYTLNLLNDMKRATP